MLTIKDLSIKDNIFDYELIHQLSFSLQANDKVAIIGSEGTGKSTLLKLLSGKKLNYIEYQGEMYSQSKIVYTEQNISYQWDDHTVYDYFFHDQDFRLVGAETRKRLSQFGFEYNEIINRYIKTFSGGEKVKISLVNALIRKPDILLLDEPSNDLDFETITFLEDFLISTEIPLMFISHDQRLIENVANGIIHLQHIHKQMIAKTFVYRGTYLEYKDLYFRKFKSDLQIARKQRSDYEQKMKKFRQVYSKVEYQQNQAVRNPEMARLLKKKIHSLKSQEKRYLKEKEDWTEIPEREEPMNIFFDQTNRLNSNKRIFEFEVNDFVLPNKKTIRHIDLNITGDDLIVIYGRNGVGKTTFIKKVIETLEQKNISFGYIPQNYMDLLNHQLRVVEYLMDKQSKYPEYRVRQILGQLGFKRDEMDGYCKELSEGQKLKLLLFLLVAKDSEILILDEPTRNISPINQDEIYDLFLSYPGAILAVTHDRTFIETVFDQIYELTEEGLILK